MDFISLRPDLLRKALGWHKMEPCVFEVLIILFIFLLVYRFYERSNHFRFFENLGIPGPRPSLIFGNIFQLRLSKNLVLDVMTKWEKEYGPIYGYFVGYRPILVVKEPALISEILVKNSKAFVNRPKFVVHMDPLRDTLPGLRGERWKKVRGLLSPLFTGSKLKHSSVYMHHCLQTTLKLIEQSGGEEDIEIYKFYQRLTCDVIGRFALAMDLDSQSDRNNEFYKTVNGFMQNAMSRFVYLALIFPSFACISEYLIKLFGISGKMTKMIIQSVTTAMRIRREKQVTRNGNQGRGFSDALQLMMEQSSKGLTDQEIVANSWTFILGGFETTSAALTFTTYLLTKHPDIQEKLFQELCKRFQADEIPTYKSVLELKYLDQVVCESMRLFPPIVSFLTRQAECDVTLGPYTIPKGTDVQIPIWQVHYDPKIWPDPEKFDPERFSQNYDNTAYLPFGGGPRNCIGARFGILEVKLTLAMILCQFRMVPGENFPEDKVQLTVPTISICPKNDLNVKFIRR